MLHREEKYNPKRKIRGVPVTRDDRAALDRMAKKASYGGNPEHKINPGDFGLTPPANWRSDKELCDRIEIFKRSYALKLLRKGIRNGVVSKQERNGWPQNVWSITNDGEPLESELENQETGAYHGYPMSEKDPFRDEVLKRWKSI